MAVDAARAKSLFLIASDLADATERGAYLDRECGGDAELRGRVEALLRANDAAPLPPDGAPDATSAHVSDRQPPTEDYGDPTACIGAILGGKYKLIEEIGAGGMGSVYLAQQTEPVKRAVAVKVIKAGMDSRAVIARFEAERQALAMMDHPNIARVLDAGTTGGGRPFFVMELVKGVPITQYCDERKLTPNARLELFVPVCQAIQHAHQKGIIHRDIKPSNVLVALYDDRPVPKVIDFGVAKAAGQMLTDKTVMTGFGAVVGTPEYMSPEQASLNNLDIDTRSDVYSLGVLLYELLTGSTPIDRKSLGKAALLEVLRIVREVEAPKPSHKLSSSAALPSISASRGTEPARLSKLLKGELDWVVMKALEKDRTRRYETANGLARDIQHYLNDEVVEARPPSASYQVSKFVRRHKGQVLAASLVLLTLLAGIAGTTWGLIAAAERVKERDAALDHATRQRDNSVFLLARAACNARDFQQARLRLSSIEAKHRGWEWYYLRRECRGGIFTLYGHTDAVTSVAFSRDGTRIVTGSRDQTAKVWDARAGTLQLEMKGHAGEVSSVAFSPDGTRIVTGSADHSAKVWDARAGGPPLVELKGHTDVVSGVAFSPDGTRIVTGSWDQTAKVWDARTGTLQLEWKGYTNRVSSVAFSPDGTRIVTGSVEGSAHLWDARTGGTPQLVLMGAGVSNVAFSPDGTRIVTGSADNSAKVWDARGGKLQLELKGQHTSVVSGVAFSPDGMRIVTGSWDQTAKVWDARTGRHLLDLVGHTSGISGVAFSGHTSSVSGVAFSPDGTHIVTGSADGTAQMWDARTGTPLLDLKGHVGRLYGVAFSPDGTRIVTGGGDDKTAKVWDVRTGTILLDLTGHMGTVSGVAFSPDGTRIATGSLDQTAKVWDARTGTLQRELTGHTNGVSSVAFSPDGTRIATGSYDRTARVWDARTGTLQRELTGHTAGVASVAFSPGGTRIVTGSDDWTARVWDAWTWTGTPLLELKGHTHWVRSVAFSPDGTRIVTGSWDRTAQVWDARTGTPLLELKGHTAEVSGVAFSPDSTRIVTGSGDNTAKVWDARTGTPLVELSGHTQLVFGVSFSPDGMRIVTSSWDATAKVWDARAGTPLLELQGHTGQVATASFSPDGTRIVTGSRDCTAQVWDTRTGTPLLELKGHKNWVWSAAFSPDGTRIVTGSRDQTAKVWDARTGTLQRDLKGPPGWVLTVAFSPDGTRIVTNSVDETRKDARTGYYARKAQVWDARTGQELKGEPIPPTIANNGISPDGRLFAHREGDRVDLISLQPNEEELAYRLLHTQPNLERYRESYEEARAAKDDFAARFYIQLLPPAERPALEAQLP